MRTLPRILALAAALSIAAPAAPALAQQPTKAQQQEAATRFKKGLELFKEGDYQAALIEFRRANELAPNYNVLYNIGQVYFQLQDYPGALHALERYLAEGGNAINASRRADVLKDIEKLKARVANIEISSAVADAEVTIDDVVVGKTPLAKPVMVSAGRHKVTISKSGFTPASKVVEIASAEKQAVQLDPVEQKSATPVVVQPPPPVVVQPPPPAQTAPPEPPPPPPSKPVPVAGIVVTSVLTVGAVVTGVLSLSAKSALQDEVKSPTATRDSLDSAHSKLTGLALATDILAGSAIVAGGVTLIVGLTGGPAKKDEQKPASLPKVRVGVGPGSVSLLGSF
jgi:hypothetical protein